MVLSEKMSAAADSALREILNMTPEELQAVIADPSNDGPFTFFTEVETVCLSKRAPVTDPEE